MNPSLKGLVNKANTLVKNSLESAAGLCLSRTHYEVEIEHLLLKLVDTVNCDAVLMLKASDVDMSRFMKDITASLDGLKSGSGRNPVLSESLVKMITLGWTWGSIDEEAREIRSGHLLIALASDKELTRLGSAISPQLSKLSPEFLRNDFRKLTQSSVENTAVPESAAPGRQSTGGKTPFLDQYTVNLTENARQGAIDPVLARDKEIRQVVDILTRRRQNNPILVGEAGVGKTAVVEGFAIRVAQGDVPPPLRNVSLRALDLALLQAGAGVKGEFENRLKSLVNEVKSSPVPVILFIDEAHTMIGAGGQAGQNDAANILKPALARGELRTIAATTWSEYKKYFEKDSALTRRFQVVKVDEPTEEACKQMLRGILPVLERHHNVRILAEGLDSAVRLSHRYLPDRQLPDKAVSVLDTACARLALGQSSIPPAIEEAVRALDDLAVRRRILQQESQLGADHQDQLNEIERQRADWDGRKTQLDRRWQKESELVTKIREVRTQLEDNPPVVPAPPDQASAVASNGAAAQPATLRDHLKQLNTDLDSVQGDTPMIRVCVDSQVVGEVISNWTGIPVGRMLKDEVATMLSLESHLEKRVVGQAHALEAISRRVRTSKASLDDPAKPVGVFLLVGPSGVGKTETALALSELLYGGERNLITINMSEFQEAHTVSTLKGSPPGYVGYGEGGVLTEAVRRRPYSVVLLDEVEKAHPDVLELFFQVFDKGQMEDGEGREIDFKNTIIILTSNTATDTLVRHISNSVSVPAIDDLVAAIKPELNRVFKPAFLGRLVIIPYLPLRDDSLKDIIRLKLSKIQRRLDESHRVTLTYSDEVVSEVARRCTEVESGARNVDNILTNGLLPELSNRLLELMEKRERASHFEVNRDEKGNLFFNQID